MVPDACDAINQAEKKKGTGGKGKGGELNREG